MINVNLYIYSEDKGPWNAGTHQFLVRVLPHIKKIKYIWSKQLPLRQECYSCILIWTSTGSRDIGLNVVPRELK